MNWIPVTLSVANLVSCVFQKLSKFILELIELLNLIYTNLKSFQRSKTQPSNFNNNCNGVVECRRTVTQAAESVKWRPQQAYSNQGLLLQQQFSAHPKSSLARIDKRTARAARNTCYRYNQIGPLDHKMANNCVSLAHTDTVSFTISNPIKT